MFVIKAIDNTVITVKILNRSSINFYAIYFLMEITKYYSPNYNKKVRSGKSITMIIIHYTGMQSERESLKRLTSVSSKVSAHYLIGRSGRIFNLVDVKYIAWHAGKSMWKKIKI